ncbi:MAG: hypothetical protein JXB23_12900 [Candidatus Aminicenantes bacterium]|nr:hypothetical protein [Candidatus Aminicenantes bacterium]
MKTCRSCLLIVLTGLLFASCGTQTIETDLPAGLDPKYSAYSYKAEDREAVMIVDYEVARLRKEENYFPLDVMIANKKLASLTITRNSLILIDSGGKAYNMAAIDEVQDKYKKLLADSDLKYATFESEQQAMTGFSHFERQRSNFFPMRAGGARVTERVIVRPRGYINDRLYFPMPETGINKQKLTLRLAAAELEVPLEVIFTVK